MERFFLKLVYFSLGDKRDLYASFGFCVFHIKITFLSLIAFISITTASGQIYENQQQETTFSSRLKNPIKIDVSRTGNSLVFYAENRSYHPYEVTLTFNQYKNLEPYRPEVNKKVLTGRNRLIRLTIKEGLEPLYSYHFKYRIYGTLSEVEKDHPYLIPLKPGKVYTNLMEFAAPFLRMKVMPKDTVVNSRKGMVTATHDFGQGDFLSDNSLIEVRHDDSTLALYKYVGGRDVQLLVQPGQTVYPGQPLFIPNVETTITFQVVQLTGNYRSVTLIPQYVITSEKVEKITSAQSIEVVHPEKIVTRELNKKELKKLKKGMLY